MYNNVDGEGLLTIFTKNISTQQSYNFQKGDVVRITGYNEDSVELKVQSGFVDETSGEGVERVRLPVLGGSGYVYPPKVYYEGTRMVAPIIPILLDGKVVAFDMPNRARIVSLEQNTLTLSGSGLWFENDQATIRVHDGGAEFVVRMWAPTCTMHVIIERNKPCTCRLTTAFLPCRTGPLVKSSQTVLLQSTTASACSPGHVHGGTYGRALSIKPL